MGIWRIGFFLAEYADRHSTSTGGRGLGRKRDSLRTGPLRLQMLLLIFLLLALWAPTAICGEEAPPKNKEAGPAFSFLTWGRVLIATEQFSQAASYLEKEVENRPDSTEAYMLLGKAYWGMGRIKDARAAWEKAIALEPNSAPLVKARLARLDRLQNLIIISNEINAEERVPPFFVRDTISAYFSNLGFNISPKLSGEFLARLTSTLESLAPPALDEIRKISNADILILSEAVSYLEFQDFKEKEVKVIARLSASAIDLHSYSKLGSYQTLRTADAATLLEASEKVLKEGGMRVAREILQQIAFKESLKPFLVVDRGDIVIPKVTFPEGSNIPIEITVHNQGDEEARNFEVQVLETSSDNEDKPIDSFLVAFLPPLSSVTFKAQWEARRPGLQKIRVLIRPGTGPKGSESVSHLAYQEVLILPPAEILISLYRLASNYTPPGSPDRSLLEAQLRVALNPQDEAALQNLLKAAVDPEGTYVTVIGLGLRPWNIFSEEVAFPMAKRGARVDAQNWLALIRKALGKGYIESGIPLRAQVYGARILLEQVLPDGSVMLKMLAPL
jgi:tetratricopeptide (TPR) repeat protein